MAKLYGEAKNGKVFLQDCVEVKEMLERFPDLTLEAAIGNVVMEYEKTLVEEEVSKAEEPVESAAE